MNILIVEDNKFEMNNIVRTIEAISGKFQVYKAYTGKECFQILDKVDIDVFVLDIQLPDMSGLQIAERIRKISKYELTYMIFITTHIQFQLDAFKRLHCYDFLEKPYKKEELTEIITRLWKGISTQRKQIEESRESVIFSMRDLTLKIYMDEILFIESHGRHCIVHTKVRDHFIKNTTISKILESLPPKDFMQTHKSYIVSLSNIHKVEKQEKNSWTVYFRGTASIAYVSNRHKEKFSEKIVERGK
ncbi:LytR/AlgR family response regulator transcription factor [Alkaliphilus oremlandii]|uniref:Stage 0 sporulation protein A homolog n=1 Tax=Alkaliphilus oremlandii (strain OhILAs) TaxID=350688 RepID=A8MIZ8_ALKOO|nr:LytTR family DNA-binding domain-containing protein [Alkaliphilus oremlandii]ABW19780.1 two component transcriptional regulator, LytTR family [Alkaliphilus oremlandii OhILAs]